MALSVVKEDNRFRVEWQVNSTDWLPETPSNRKVVLVFLRWLLDELCELITYFLKYPPQCRIIHY